MRIKKYRGVHEERVAMDDVYAARHDKDQPTVLTDEQRQRIEQVMAAVGGSVEEFIHDNDENEWDWPNGREDEHPYDDLPYADVPYTGAPDECDIHWPTKLDVDGHCPTREGRCDKHNQTFDEQGRCLECLDEAWDEYYREFPGDPRPVDKPDPALERLLAEENELEARWQYETTGVWSWDTLKIYSGMGCRLAGHNHTKGTQGWVIARFLGHYQGSAVCLMWRELDVIPPPDGWEPEERVAFFSQVSFR